MSNDLVVNFKNLPADFIACSNHLSPYRIDGVAKARLINSDIKQQYLLVYSVYGQQNGIGITEETYDFVRSLFRDLSNRPLPENSDTNLSDNELRLTKGLVAIQRMVRELKSTVASLSYCGTGMGLVFGIEEMLEDLLKGKDV